MKAPLAVAAVLFASVALAAAPVSKSTKVSGDYVEARTASVFAGACHYNGELVTTGQDAILAWNITGGEWKGADLRGVRAMAAVDSQLNLGKPGGNRKSELVVDTSASDAQAAAFADMLRTKFSSQLGSIVAVRRAPVSFEHVGRKYTVKSTGFAAMTVSGMPNDECCSQPSLVWYSPLVPLEHRKVGYTAEAKYTAGRVGDAWDRSDENSAFYGAFRF